jgi:hypothetical protein
MMHTISLLLAAVSLVSAKPLDARFKSSFSGGDITFYEGGLTACGKTIDTNSDKTVAVSFNVFDNFPGAGANSNKNPICKTHVKATINGKTQTLLVQDSCQGCKDGDLDLTQAAWDGFGLPRSVGRKAGLKWEFIGVGGGDDSGDSSNDTPATTKKAEATTTKKAEEPTSSTKKEETASKTSSSASEEPTKPTIAVSGGAVDNSDDASSESDSSKDTVTSTATSAAAESSASESTDSSSDSSDDSSAGSGSDGSSDASSNSSDAGSDSSAAGDVPKPSSESPAPVESSPAPANVSAGSLDECNAAWTACNSKFKGTAEDVKSYSCQDDYVTCVNAAMGKSERRRSLRRHIAHSRLESF